jgi:hypothetical protein
MVKARLFLPTGEASDVTTAEFAPAPPPPAKPQVYVSDLQMIKGSVGWGGTPKRDRSIEGRTLSMLGDTYEKGIGVSSYSELVYDIEPGYKRFVALAGIDDEMYAVHHADIVGADPQIGHARIDVCVAVDEARGDIELRLFAPSPAYIECRIAVQHERARFKSPFLAVECVHQNTFSHSAPPFKSL